MTMAGETERTGAPMETQVIKQVSFWATVGLIVRSLAIDFGPEF